MVNVPPRVLVAAQREAWPLLKSLLEERFDAVPAHTMDEALQRLATGDIDLVVSTLSFSESRMLEFVVTVKAEPATSAIPFLCCRALVGVLSDRLVENLGNAAKLCGAAGFVNIAGLPVDEAKAALLAAVSRALQSGQ